MVITDGVHLVSTESEAELHEFAQRLGFKREWYQGHPQNPHYDLTTTASVVRAIKAGAQKVRPLELLRRAWWSPYKRKIDESISSSH